MCLIPGLQIVEPLFTLEERAAPPGCFRVMSYDPLTDTRVCNADKGTFQEAWRLVGELTDPNGVQEQFVFNHKGEHVDANGEVHYMPA